MTSTSSDGSSVIVLQFSLNLNIDVAEQEVQAAINAAQGYLPTDLPVPPVYSKSNPADATCSYARAHFQCPMPLSRVEDLVDTASLQDLPAQRCRPGHHQRRAEACRPRAGQPHGSRCLRRES